MSRLLLALLAAFPLQPDEAREPAGADPNELPLDDLGRVPVSVLLAHMPKDPWNRDGFQWTLEPIPQELQRRAENGLLSDDDWRAVLVAEDVIHTRARWPAGQPLGVWIHQPPWLRACRITARAVQPDLGSVVSDRRSPITCGNAALDSAASMRRLTFARLPAGTTSLQLEITIEQRSDPERLLGTQHTSRELWSGLLELPVQACASVDDVLQATSTPAQEAALLGSLHAYRTTGDRREDQPLTITVGGDNASVPALHGVGLSLEVELLHGAQVVERADLVVDEGTDFYDTQSGLRGWCNLHQFPAELDAPESDRSGWALRVRGRPDGLLQVWEVDCWWNGTETIPISQVLTQGGN